jgi:hypothetical protein
MEIYTILIKHGYHECNMHSSKTFNIRRETFPLSDNVSYLEILPFQLSSGQYATGWESTRGTTPPPPPEKI